MWVKLTNAYDGDSIIHINLDRFDKIFTVQHGDDIVTRISATLSETEEDEHHMDVKETPEEIMRLAGSAAINTRIKILT